MAGGPTDFDDLLRRLGAAEADPPPLMKKLLDEHRLKSTSSADTALIAELEAWLSLVEEERRRRTAR